MFKIDRFYNLRSGTFRRKACEAFTGRCELQHLLEDTTAASTNAVCKKNAYEIVTARLTGLLCPPGGGQRGRAQAEVREAVQRGDRNPAEGRSQLYDRPRQGRGYNPPRRRAHIVYVTRPFSSHLPPAFPLREVHRKSPGAIVLSLFFSSFFF